jgi:Trp operon repressor
MKSTVGRPRALTDRQVREVLAEHARFLTWKALRSTVKSQRELAQELGVSQGTINLAIRTGGQYKQVSPDRRAEELAARRLRLAAGRTRGSR